MKGLVVILGPTGSGKSRWAIALAKRFKGEIICADSRTIYRGFVIGAASPQLEKNYQEVPHHLLHCFSPEKTFTAAQFQSQAEKIIKEIHKKGKIPFLVGGTGLYIDAVTKKLLIPRVPPNKKLREKLVKMSNKLLAEKLKMLDKKTYERIDLHNKRRLIRALEVCLLTGKPFSSYQKIQKPPYKILKIGIALPQEKLFQNINRRVEEMFKKGLLEEVKELLQKGYSLELPAMSGLGYKQVGEFLVNKSKTFAEVVLDIKLKTRQYAKRQMTWFKRDKEIHWVKNYEEAEKLVKEFVQKVS